MAVRLRSYERSSETDVILVLPEGKANRDFVRLVVEENEAGRPFRLDDLLLLNHVYLERRTTAKEAAKIIQKPENESRAALERLVASGGSFLIYAHLKASTDSSIGLEEKDIDEFTRQMRLIWRADSLERGKRQAVWMEFER